MASGNSSNNATRKEQAACDRSPVNMFVHHVSKYEDTHRLIEDFRDQRLGKIEITQLFGHRDAEQQAAGDEKSGTAALWSQLPTGRLHRLLAAGSGSDMIRATSRPHDLLNSKPNQMMSFLLNRF